jgi:hypothetical protein
MNLWLNSIFSKIGEHLFRRMEWNDEKNQAFPFSSRVEPPGSCDALLSAHFNSPVRKNLTAMAKSVSRRAPF